MLVYFYLKYFNHHEIHKLVQFVNKFDKKNIIAVSLYIWPIQQKCFHAMKYYTNNYIHVYNIAFGTICWYGIKFNISSSQELTN